MNWKAWAPLAVAAILGLIAAKVAKDMAAKKGSEESKYAKVVVAKDAIPPGTILRTEDLVMGSLATEKPPEGAFTNAAELTGRVTNMQLIKGQPVLNALLAEAGANGGLQTLVPPGMRAITIEVNEFSGVGNLLTLGARVDIIASMNDQQIGAIVTKTIVQNVKVSALGQKVGASTVKPEDAEAPPWKSVTLLVKPEEAEAIELATMTGRPRLVLRGNGDTASASSEGITVGDIIGRYTKKTAQNTGSTPNVAPVAFRPTTRQSEEEPFIDRTVKVIRGGAESDVTFKIPAKPEKVLQGANSDGDAIH